MAKLYEQYQYYKGNKYGVSDLVDASKDLKVELIDVRLINKDYNLLGEEENVVDLVREINQVLEADLKYPIIISESSFVLDGKHRLVKAMLENKKTIKCRFIKDVDLPFPL